MKNKYPLKIKAAIIHKGILKLLIKYLEKTNKKGRSVELTTKTLWNPENK